MYTLHIANKNYSSWSLRPWVLMQELSIPFTEEQSTFKPDSNWDEFREFSPSGLVPCLIDNGQAVWDSLAITEYLAEKHAEVWPADASARAWARCATAEMHSGFSSLRDQCPMSCGIRVKMNTIDASLQRDLDRLDELWNEGLRRFQGPFLAGSQFTAIDAFYAPVAFRIRTYALEMSVAALAYVGHLLALNSMKLWEQGALEEASREPGHEEDTLKSGTIVEDFRKV